MGVFLWLNLFHRVVRVSSSIHLNTCKFYVCGIKLETKVMRLHKILVEKISWFHLKKSAVNYF